MGSLLVMALDSWLVGHKFDSQPLHCQVTTLGKLFPTYIPPWLSKIDWYWCKSQEGNTGLWKRCSLPCIMPNTRPVKHRSIFCVWLCWHMDYVTFYVRWGGAQNRIAMRWKSGSHSWVLGTLCMPLFQRHMHLSPVKMLLWHGHQNCFWIQPLSVFTRI